MFPKSQYFVPRISIACHIRVYCAILVLQYCCCSRFKFNFFVVEVPIGARFCMTYPLILNIFFPLNKGNNVQNLAGKKNHEFSINKVSFLMDRVWSFLAHVFSFIFYSEVSTTQFSPAILHLPLDKFHRRNSTVKISS